MVILLEERFSEGWPSSVEISSAQYLQSRRPGVNSSDLIMT